MKYVSRIALLFISMLLLSPWALSAPWPNDGAWPDAGGGGAAQDTSLGPILIPLLVRDVSPLVAAGSCWPLDFTDPVIPFTNCTGNNATPQTGLLAAGTYTFDSVVCVHLNTSGWVAGDVVTTAMRTYASGAFAGRTTRGSWSIQDAITGDQIQTFAVGTSFTVAAGVGVVFETTTVTDLGANNNYIGNCTVFLEKTS